MAMAYSSQFNLDKLRQSLFAKQGRANASMRQATEAGAERIMKKSQDNSPVDTYNLEEAHHIQQTLTEADHVRYKIEVSGSGFGSENPRDVESYAMLVHENMAPYGTGELNGKPFHAADSPQNNAKIAAGKDVGGKFLDRAVESEKKIAIEGIRQAVKRSLK